MADDKQIVTGIVLSRTHLEWTSVRLKKVGTEVINQGEIAIDPDEELAPQIKTAANQLKGRLRIGLASDRALIRVIDLPTTDPEEIEGMVDLQVDKFSPFPADQMQVAHEVLHTTDTSSRVLVAAVQRHEIEQLGDAFLAAGLHPHTIDVHILGWWHLLKQKNSLPTEGTHILLLLETGATELLVLQDGIPLMIRALGGREGHSEQTFYNDLTEETEYTLTTLETEWGIPHVSNLSLWHESSEPTALAETLHRTCTLSTQTHALSQLPHLSEGLAQRADLGTDALNLVIPEWGIQARQKQFQRRLLMATAALVALWVVLSGALFGLAKSSIASTNTLKQEVETLEGPAREIERMRRKIEELEQYADRTYSGLECLHAAVELLPQGVEFNSFSYKKNHSISLSGKADSANPIYDFFEALEKSDTFVNTQPDGIRTKSNRGKNVSEFKVSADLPTREEPDA